MEEQITLDNLKTFLACIDTRYVQQKPGYGLSSNDFEDKYKERIKTIEPNAEKNVITGISVEGDDLEVNADRIAMIEAVTEDDIKEIAKEVSQGTGGGSDFEIATSDDIYAIVHS